MIPDEVRDARANLGVSQRRLAYLLNVRQGAVREWETGETPVDLRTSMAISLLLLAQAPNEAALVVARLQERVGISADSEPEEE